MTWAWSLEGQAIYAPLIPATPQFTASLLDLTLAQAHQFLLGPLLGTVVARQIMSCPGHKEPRASQDWFFNY